jgi:hypothetical protein
LPWITSPLLLTRTPLQKQNPYQCALTGYKSSKESIISNSRKMSPTGVLIIGGTRGLGAEFVKQYAARQNEPVYTTTRSGSAPDGFPTSVKWLPNIDLMKSGVGDAIVSSLDAGKPLSTVVSKVLLNVTITQ